MNIRTRAFEATKGGNEPTPAQAVDFGDPGYSPAENCECYRRYRFDENKGPFLGFLIIALTLVIIAALLAGLTLAISSLDMTWLQIMSTTGPKRRRWVSFRCSIYVMLRLTNFAGVKQKLFLESKETPAGFS
ncbi:hypothetical protein VE03_05345 [Pseudogymnoascus sp. 23342-1-I1]|nr:hypothetical protein VE03_05345 [Pseudogymnoascus sp. 23342-1-I1]